MRHLIRRFSIVISVLVVVLASAIFTAPTKAHAASNCVPQSPTAPAHSPTTVSSTGLANTASTKIGQIGKRAPASGNPSWDGDDRVNALTEVGTTVYAAGKFDSYVWNGKTYSRHNVVAFNADTGAPTSFAPNVDGEILTIAPSCTGTLMYIGGYFHTVNGVKRNYAAKIAVTTSALATWNPNPNDVVEGISMLRGHLVVAGRFSQISGVSRTNWASLNQTAAKATADSWLNISVAGNDPAGPRKVIKVVQNHHQTYAVAIGNFNTIGGKAHRRIVVLELTDAKVLVMPWSTPLTASNNNSNAGTDCSAGYPDPERDVTWTPNDARFVTASTGGPHAGSICDGATSWSAATSVLSSTTVKPLAIQATGGDTLTGVACSDVSCLTSGHNRWADNPPIWYSTPVNGSHVKTVRPCSPETPVDMNAGHAGYNCQNPASMGGTSVVRSGIMEVSIGTLKATSWNPGRSKQRAMHNTMMLTPQGLWLGSDGDQFGGVDHNDIVLVPFATTGK